MVAAGLSIEVVTTIVRLLPSEPRVLARGGIPVPSAQATPLVVACVGRLGLRPSVASCLVRHNQSCPGVAACPLCLEKPTAPDSGVHALDERRCDYASGGRSSAITSSASVLSTAVSKLAPGATKPPDTSPSESD